MKELTYTDFINGKINLKKPGLLLVRADWCGHCKKYLPTYKKLAKMFPDNGDFLIVDIESKQLEKSNVSSVLQNYVRYYPTLLFFDSQGNIKQKFEGDRENLSEVLKKICSMYRVCK